MGKITFNADIMGLISLFETLTQAQVKDCVMREESLLFIVNENEIGKAVGKKGVNVRRLEDRLRKRIRVVEFNPDVSRFVRNLIMPYQAKSVIVEEGIITIIPDDHKSRGMLIGKNASILRFNESIVKRYFKDINEMKVV